MDAATNVSAAAVEAAAEAAVEAAVEEADRALVAVTRAEATISSETARARAMTRRPMESRRPAAEGTRVFVEGGAAAREATPRAATAD